jgi:hypothetical protein
VYSIPKHLSHLISTVTIGPRVTIRMKNGVMVKGDRILTGSITHTVTTSYFSAITEVDEYNSFVNSLKGITFELPLEKHLVFKEWNNDVIKLFDGSTIDGRDHTEVSSKLSKYVNWYNMN